MGRQRNRRRAERRCAVEGCERRVRPGRVVCAEHHRTGEGRAAQRALHRLVGDLTAVAAGPTGRGGERALGRIRQRAARGAYGDLLDEALLEVVRQAGEERMLRDEAGAMRIAAKRLLMEEDDPSKMALGLCRSTTSLLRLLREQGAMERERERVWKQRHED